MKKFRVAIQYSAALLLCAFTLSVACTAQKPANNSQTNTLKIPASHPAITVLASSYHAAPTALPGAKQKLAPINAKGARGAELLKADPSLAAPQIVSGPKTPTPTGTHFYPADLVNSGGPLVTSTTIHDIFVNMTSGTVASNWGDPHGFLGDLSKSDFIHLTDQYTGNTGVPQHYAVESGFWYLTAPAYTSPLTDADMQYFATFVAQNIPSAGPGTTNIYNLYLMPGTDVCFDSSYSVCYSPDNYSTWYFCAYHGAVAVEGYGTVLYTVEPFQDVPGCAVQTPSPNGQLADSTNSVLSHETFETITDPVGGTGWTNITSLDLWGYEIGDECEPLGNSSGDFLTPTFYINGKQYEVQLEYSNFYHACSMQSKNVILF
jgi:hypothetical protein